MYKLAFGSLLAVSFLSGCDADCSNPERVNQTYEVWHSVINTPTVSAQGATPLTMSEGYPSYELFVNGCTQWQLTYQASANKVNVKILDIDEVQGTGDADSATAQAYEGTLKSSDENCNVFSVEIAGSYEAPTKSVHDFTYTAELSFFGDSYAGTFAYSDSFSGLDENGAAINGQIQGATGEVFGEVPAGGAFAGGTDSASAVCYGAVGLVD